MNAPHLHIAALPTELRALRLWAETHALWLAERGATLALAAPGDVVRTPQTATLSLVPQVVRLGDVTAAPVSRASLEAATQQDDFNYEGLAKRWEARVGATNLAILTRREAALPADLLTGILSHLGITDPPPAPLVASSAPGWRRLALGNVLARQMRNPPDLPAIEGEEPLILDRAFAEEIQRRFALSNAALATRLTIDAERLEPDWSDWPTEGNLHRLDQPCSFEAELGALLRQSQ